jgi:hypothetical protein
MLNNNVCIYHSQILFQINFLQSQKNPIKKPTPQSSQQTILTLPYNILAIIYITSIMPSSSIKNSRSQKDPLKHVADNYKQYFKDKREDKKNKKSLLKRSGLGSVANIVKSLIPTYKYEGGSRKTKSKKTTQKRRKHHRKTHKK